MKVAIFGGSFDPPHIGHVQIIEHLVQSGAFDQVIVAIVADNLHAYNKQLAPFPLRKRMMEAATAHLPLCIIEQRDKYTVDLLRRFDDRYDISLVVGADCIKDRHKWHKWDELCQRARLYPIARPGEPDVPDAHHVTGEAISSTQVRAAAGRGDTASLSRMVPPMVMEIILAEKLYIAG